MAVHVRSRPRAVVVPRATQFALERLAKKDEEIRQLKERVKVLERRDREQKATMRELRSRLTFALKELSKKHRKANLDIIKREQKEREQRLQDLMGY